MGLGTLTDRSTGQTILEGFFNDIHAVLNGSFVGRNTSGAATSGQDLGTSAIPWGTLRCNALVLGGSAVDTSQISRRTNQVLSGKTRSTSNQPQFILPTSGSLSLSVLGSATNLVIDVSGTSVTVNTDIPKTGLTAGPSSNHTALINDTDAADQFDTRMWGSSYHRKKITVDTMGTTFQASVGKWIGFSINDGSNTEYAIGYLESSTSISRVQRGYFYDSSGNPINPVAFANDDTVTILNLGWVFMDDDGATVDVSYNNPVWSFTAPAAPATGDYWYDLDNDLWKRYDGSSFQIIGRTLIGLFVNTSTACVGARCVDFYKAYSGQNSLDLEVNTTEIVRGLGHNPKVSVAGKLLDFRLGLPTWNITTDLAAAADMISSTEQASRVYHLYLTDEGDTVISDIMPYWREDFFGWYHPHNPWRKVGTAYNNASSNIVAASDRRPESNQIILDTSNGYGAVSTKIKRFTNTQQWIGAAGIYTDNANTGMSVEVTEPGSYYVGIQSEASAATGIGFTVNTASPTTSISSLTGASRQIYSSIAANGQADGVGKVINLLVGDIVRMHTDGVGVTTADREAFYFNKISGPF